MLVSIRRHTTLAKLWDVLMVLSLISSFYTRPLQLEQKCSTGQDVMMMTGFTVHVCFMDLIVGVGPFTFPQLSEVEQVCQWSRKSRKRT